MNDFGKWSLGDRVLAWVRHHSIPGQIETVVLHIDHRNKYPYGVADDPQETPGGIYYCSEDELTEIT